MKKNLTTLFLFAAAAVVALSFTACGEEVNIGPEGRQPIGATEFITDGGSDVATRTTIDKDRFFYWTKNDKIFIDSGTDWVMSTESDITGKTAKAKFEVPGTFSAISYPVRYTGYQKTTGTPADTMNTSATRVVIAHEQTQSAWSNGDHLAYSGDCGMATAYKQTNGKYKFQLEHQASYLFFYPYLSSRFSGNYTLQKIEIFSDLSASNIAGTYDFGIYGLLDANGLPLTPLSGTGKQKITLTCNGGFGLRQSVPDLTDNNTTYNHCVVVVAPGTHQLTVSYTVTENSTGNTLEYLQDISLTQFVPNGVYPYIYEFTPDNVVVDFGLVFNEDTYYTWGTTSPSTQNDAQYAAHYPALLTTTQATNGFWADIPNSVLNSDNCMWKYFSFDERAHIFWDNSIKWTLNLRNGGQETRRGGLWLRKKQFNLGFINNTTARARFDPVKGRPSESVLQQYFFLPAFDGERGTVYWSSSRYGTTTLCDGINISPSTITPVYVYDYTIRVAGRRPTTGNVDGSNNTKWWQ